MTSEATIFQRNGRWMSFRFLYFIYYALCRRDKIRMPDVDKPALTASYGLTYMMGGPILAALALLNHFTHWGSLATHAWLSLHLPEMGHKTSAYAFSSVLAVVDIILYKVIFSKKRYEWVMWQFNAYDITQYTIAPAIMLLFALVPVGMVGVYAYRHPVRGNLIVWSILIAIEVAFRLWWHWWCRRHGDRRQKKD